MNTYKVKIKPVDTFYFGSERKFNPADDSGTNYLVESLTTPQQTTILGMLRYALLTGQIRQMGNDLLKNDNLIGLMSFMPELKKYGIINRISPVFFDDGKTLLEEAGLNYQLYKEKTVPTMFELKKINGNANSSVPTKDVYYLNKYDHKEYLNHYLVPRGNTDKLNNLKPYDIILNQCFQPGNKKNRSGMTDDEGFYKQTKFMMGDNYSFCVFMETTHPVSESDFYATLGGDQSLFHISIQNAKSFPSNPEADNKEGIVTLISHAYLTDNVLNSTFFSIIETVNFRYLRTVLGKTKNYSSIYTQDERKKEKELNDKEKKDWWNRENRPKFSQNIRLVSKGSVFYCKDVKGFVDKINLGAGYQAIGYNYYRINY